MMNLKALITGASCGIGRDMARLLAADKGCELYLAARSEARMRELKAELEEYAPVHIFVCDLSDAESCKRLYEDLKGEDIDILINNAGFGAFGYFGDIPLERELNMIDLNVRAVHILTKKFLADFEERDRGFILNVASSAAFLPGPLMAAYYATKAYVLHLTEAVSEELRRKRSRVYIGSLCPGPVDTEFNSNAGVSFNLKSLTSRHVAEYGLRKMFSRRTVIVPGFTMKLGVFFRRFVPRGALVRIAYNIQRQKGV